MMACQLLDTRPLSDKNAQLIGTLGTNVSQISIKNSTFFMQGMSLKMSSAKYRPLYFCFNVLNHAMLSVGIYFDKDHMYLLQFC